MIADPFERTMWKYRHKLPVSANVNPVSLGEGGTPLIPSPLFDAFELFWKDETRNPTGSHKDRALALAATHAVSTGAKIMVVVSAGSTGLSNAAYAARAGLRSVTLMGRGAPAERVYPVHCLGSTLIDLECGIDEAIEALRLLSGRDGIYVASTTRSSNPVQAEAPKTIAYEIVDQLGSAPDWVVVPSGGGGTIAGIHAGFVDLRAAGLIARLPHLAAVVPAAYDALRHALINGISDTQSFAALPYSDDVPTVLTKLSHAHPPDGLAALAAIRESGGTVLAFPDEMAIDAVTHIGSTDGLYLEPSSAIVLPALQELASKGTIRPGQRVVALACGSGFRETFVMRSARPLTTVRGDIGSVRDAILAAVR